MWSNQSGTNWRRVEKVSVNWCDRTKEGRDRKEEQGFIQRGGRRGIFPPQQKFSPSREKFSPSRESIPPPSHTPTLDSPTPLPLHQQFCFWGSSMIFAYSLNICSPYWKYESDVYMCKVSNYPPPTKNPVWNPEEGLEVGAGGSGMGGRKRREGNTLRDNSVTPWKINDLNSTQCFVVVHCLTSVNANHQFLIHSVTLQTHTYRNHVHQYINYRIEILHIPPPGQTFNFTLFPSTLSHPKVQPHINTYPQSILDEATRIFHPKLMLESAERSGTNKCTVAGIVVRYWWRCGAVNFTQ